MFCQDLELMRKKWIKERMEKELEIIGWIGQEKWNELKELGFVANKRVTFFQGTLHGLENYGDVYKKLEERGYKYQDNGSYDGSYAIYNNIQFSIFMTCNKYLSINYIHEME